MSRQSRQKKLAVRKWEVDEESAPARKGAVNTARLFSPGKVKAKSRNQQDYLDAIDENDVVFGLGPAGVGKTLLAVAKAVEALQNEDVTGIVLVRPCLGLGRTSGFLPGSLGEKVGPYLRPLMDELKNFYTPDQITKMVGAGVIELTSLEYIRGRTLKHVTAILDEAQNATHDEMASFLTRLGEGSNYVITGDVTRKADGTLRQSDLHPPEQGALEHYAGLFSDIDGIETVTLTQVDVVRHPLVRKMIERGL